MGESDIDVDHKLGGSISRRTFLGGVSGVVVGGAVVGVADRLGLHRSPVGPDTAPPQIYSLDDLAREWAGKEPSGWPKTPQEAAKAFGGKPEWYTYKIDNSKRMGGLFPYYWDIANLNDQYDAMEISIQLGEPGASGVATMVAHTGGPEMEFYFVYGHGKVPPIYEATIHSVDTTNQSPKVQSDPLFLARSQSSAEVMSFGPAYPGRHFVWTEVPTDGGGTKGGYSKVTVDPVFESEATFPPVSLPSHLP